MLFWRGWGILVFIVTLGWMFIAIGLMISSGSYEPDEAKAAADIDRLFSLSLIPGGGECFLPGAV